MTRFSLAALEHEEKKLLAVFQEVYAKQIQVMRRKLILCSRCGKRSRLSSWMFIQCMWRVRPALQKGGAYWIAAEPQFCYIRCPRCKKENHLYLHVQRERIFDFLNKPNVSAENLFASVEKTNTKLS